MGDSKKSRADIRNLAPLPADSAHIIRIGSDDRDNACHDDCRDCTDSDCDARDAETVAPTPEPTPKIAAQTAPQIPPEVSSAAERAS